MSLRVKFRSHKNSRQMPLTSSPVSLYTIKEYIYDHWMGSNLRSKNKKDAPDTVIVVDEAGCEITDEQTLVDHNSLVQVRRVPGSHYRVFAGCKTEDEKIAAWVQHAEWAWKQSFRDVRRACRPQSNRKSAMGIPQAMLRKALPHEEEDALLGIGGMLVVYKTLSGSVL